MSLLPSNWKIINVGGVSTAVDGIANDGEFWFVGSQPLVVNGIEVTPQADYRPDRPDHRRFLRAATRHQRPAGGAAGHVLYRI